MDAARAVGERVASGQCEQGLLFCTTGTGVTIIANKIPGIRAALCLDAFAARIARLANNANVIMLSMWLTGEPLAREIVDTWLATKRSTKPRRVLQRVADLQSKGLSIRSVCYRLEELSCKWARLCSQLARSLPERTRCQTLHSALAKDGNRC